MSSFDRKFMDPTLEFYYKMRIHYFTNHSMLIHFSNTAHWTQLWSFCLKKRIQYFANLSVLIHFLAQLIWTQPWSFSLKRRILFFTDHLLDPIAQKARRSSQVSGFSTHDVYPDSARITSTDSVFLQTQP
ncbi:hypothetical protein RRG08_041393 [Elysia crispata]|uniref:Uncharacterized protein n=1 Tax=Elysia crispata TaxID=231223 RepID=A0AAE1CLA2_9GAST|nr:hypothetical protein RRG08_041393 [Elysia crispata]